VRIGPSDPERDGFDDALELDRRASARLADGRRRGPSYIEAHLVLGD
jgi:hypothetical protein